MPSIELTKKFWSKVDKNGPLIVDTNCWIYLSAKDKDGYGRFHLGGGMKVKETKAHRYAAELMFGPLGNKHVLHICDNPACVRHLRLGSNGDNIRDCVAKGRHSEVRKTHCPQGHPYDDRNTFITPTSGSRQCKICRLRRRREWWKKRTNQLFSSHDEEKRRPKPERPA